MMEMEGDMMQSSLEDVLSEQVRTLGMLSGCQRRLLESARRRDWVALIKETSEIEELSAEFEALESCREALISLATGKESGEASFYSVTAAFPQERKQALNALFRELKRELVLSKAENSALAGFVAGERAALSALLEHIAPGARDGVYDRRGALSSGQGGGIMIDAVL